MITFSRVVGVDRVCAELDLTVMGKRQREPEEAQAGQINALEQIAVLGAQKNVVGVRPDVWRGALVTGNVVEIDLKRRAALLEVRGALCTEHPELPVDRQCRILRPLLKRGTDVLFQRGRVEIKHGGS